MDWLAARAGIRPGTRVDLLSNRLALIAPKQSRTALEIGPGFPLAAALEGGRLAMADTRAVPAGIYGRTALEALGVWNAVSGSVAQSENVRAALSFVARAEAPLGIVYASDAVAEPRVRVVAIFPSDSHPPIIYPVAVTAQSRHQDAVRFVAFLRSPAARAIFEAEGFSMANPD
jgi:molybdate transport system substrate-binding protein